MNKYALIAAGGSGTRMESDIPKQFIPLAGKPILVHTIQKFISAIPGINIILVLPWHEIASWNSFNLQFPGTDITVVEGGANRFQSVNNGLHAINRSSGSIIAIHDGVRPLVSPGLIQKCFDSVEEFGSAVPVCAVKESLRILEGNDSSPVLRSMYRSVQTPQCFRLEEIKKAYEQAQDDSFTDDASVAAVAGIKIHLMEGEETNIKITTPFDLMIAEAYLKGSKS